MLFSFIFKNLPSSYISVANFKVLFLKKKFKVLINFQDPWNLLGKFHFQTAYSPREGSFSKIFGLFFLFVSNEVCGFGFVWISLKGHLLLVERSSWVLLGFCYYIASLHIANLCLSSSSDTFWLKQVMKPSWKSRGRGIHSLSCGMKVQSHGKGFGKKAKKKKRTNKFLFLLSNHSKTFLLVSHTF